MNELLVVVSSQFLEVYCYVKGFPSSDKPSSIMDLISVLPLTILVVAIR